MAKKINYKKLMKKKNVSRKDLAIKFKCSISNINYIIWGVTQKGDIKQAIDAFLIKEEQKWPKEK